MPEIIRQIDFANMAGVTRQHVSLAIKRGKIVVNDERHIVFDANLTQMWFKDQVAKNGVQLKEKLTVETKPVIKPKKVLEVKNFVQKIDDVTPPRVKQVPSDDDKTLLEIKTEQEIRRIKADVQLKELKYSVERGDLVEKKKLAYVLFKYLDALNLAMLDFPEMIIDELIDKIKSGMDRGELIKFMRDHLGETISRTKRQVKERIE